MISPDSEKILTPQSDIFSIKLLQWFDVFGRKDLPWQKNPSAYSVWVSEIMLQQTQVNTVIPYYDRFMKTFPDLEALAQASEDKVLHHWSGLGYYARASNLHKTAKIILSHYQGMFPKTQEGLESLPGIGRSTAGAICAIAYKKSASILDGNVKRVLARHETIDGWTGHSKTLKLLSTAAENYTPTKRIADYTQAIMDLGATLCTRSKPKCHKCPISDSCKSFIAGNPENYPKKKPTKKIPSKSVYFLIMINLDGKLLMQKRPINQLWGGLWAFPECDNIAEVSNSCDEFGQSAKTWSILPSSRHSFSHYHLDYSPVMIKSAAQNIELNRKDILWYDPNKPHEIGMPKPVTDLLVEIKKRN